MKLGIAGGLTRAFIQSPLTPLFLLAHWRWASWRC
jgi:hypothetical protein